MATFRKKRSRKYKRRNTRRNTRRNMRRNMRKSHIKRRGKKSLVGGLNLFLDISKTMRKLNASITMPKMLSSLEAEYKVHLDSYGTIQSFSTEIKQLCSNLLSIQPQNIEDVKTKYQDYNSKVEEFIKEKNKFIIYLHEIPLHIMKKQLEAAKGDDAILKKLIAEQEKIIYNVKKILPTEETTHEDKKTTHEDKGIDKYSYYNKVKKKEETIISAVKTLEESTNPLIIESVNKFCRLTQKFIENYMEYYNKIDIDWIYILSRVKAKDNNTRIVEMWKDRKFKSAKYFAKIMYELLIEEGIEVTNDEFSALIINLKLIDELQDQLDNFAWWEDDINATVVAEKK